MVFEILSTNIAVWTGDLSAWFAAVPRFPTGVARWFTDGRIAKFASHLVPWISLLLRFADDLVSRRSARAIVPYVAIALVQQFAGGPIPRFGSGQVQRIGGELLARSFHRQQMLRVRGIPSEAPVRTLSAAGLSVPPVFRVRVERHLS